MFHRQTFSNVVFAVAVVAAAIPSAAAVEPAAEAEWPARANGEYVHKTFRFRPAAIEYRSLPTRRSAVLVVFKIQDPQIPADYFTLRCWADELDEFKQTLTEDEGHLTVDAYWMNKPISRDEFRGSDEHWIDGRVLLGDRVRKPLEPR